MNLDPMKPAVLIGVALSITLMPFVLIHITDYCSYLWLCVKFPYLDVVASFAGALCIGATCGFGVFAFVRGLQRMLK